MSKATISWHRVLGGFHGRPYHQRGLRVHRGQQFILLTNSRTQQRNYRMFGCGRLTISSTTTQKRPSLMYSVVAAFSSKVPMFGWLELDRSTTCCINIGSRGPRTSMPGSYKPRLHTINLAQVTTCVSLSYLYLTYICSRPSSIHGQLCLF